MEITDLKPYLQNALHSKGINTLSEVQQCMEDILKNEDVCVISPTGSGKTLSYVLPVLQKLEIQTTKKHLPFALILVPTRELALQVASVIRSLLEHTEGIRTAVLTGGVDIQKQIRSFSHGADIVVGTPARICDHLRRHTLKPKNVQMVVLDEADEMLSMGFEEDVLKVLSSLDVHQTLLFSATTNDHVQKLSASIQIRPLFLKYTESNVLPQHIHFKWFAISEKRKLKVLQSQLSDQPALVFCNTKKQAEELYQILKDQYSCNRIYSGMDSKVRKQILQDFKNHTFSTLICTDLLGRGIDICEVELVINYAYPDTDVLFTHRIGRTARANHTGTCITFLSNRELTRLQDIETIVRQSIKLQRL